MSVEAKKPKSEMSRPVFLRKLVDKINRTNAAQEIGISKTAVSQALLDDSVRVPIEMAAELVYRRKYEAEGSSDRMLVFVKVPKDETETFHRVLSGLGYKHRSFSD